MPPAPISAIWIVSLAVTLFVAGSLRSEQRSCQPGGGHTSSKEVAS